MVKFMLFTTIDKTKVYIDPRQVVAVCRRLNAPGTFLSLSNGKTHVVSEPIDEVVHDLEAGGN